MDNVMGVFSKISTSLQQGKFFQKFLQISLIFCFFSGDYDVAKQSNSGNGPGNDAFLRNHGSNGFSSLTSATLTAAATKQVSLLFFNSL